jgi:hypothetical protein
MRDTFIDTLEELGIMKSNVRACVLQDLRCRVAERADHSESADQPADGRDRIPTHDLPSTRRTRSMLDRRDIRSEIASPSIVAVRCVHAHDPRHHGAIDHA